MLLIVGAGCDDADDDLPRDGAAGSDLAAEGSADRPETIDVPMFLDGPPLLDGPAPVLDASSPGFDADEDPDAPFYACSVRLDVSGPPAVVFQSGQSLHLGSLRNGLYQLARVELWGSHSPPPAIRRETLRIADGPSGGRVWQWAVEGCGGQVARSRGTLIVDESRAQVTFTVDCSAGRLGGGVFSLLVGGPRLTTYEARLDGSTVVRVYRTLNEDGSVQSEETGFYDASGARSLCD